ncbi:MAG: hypothetical protein ACK56V_07235 [Bacteroidota bacterium]
MIQEIKDFRPSKNIIMACLITGIYDVNRSETLEDDNYELIRNWVPWDDFTRYPTEMITSRL